jgi:hypothetical protein
LQFCGEFAGAAGRVHGWLKGCSEGVGSACALAAGEAFHPFEIEVGRSVVEPALAQ